tara:strand:- start:45 stop:386 length:342 start_codon:yes stop_codon:yes gene_type:complete
MNKYKWNCTDVEVYTSYTDDKGNTEPLVIFKVNWELIVSDELGNVANHEGVQTLNVDNLSNFKGFDTITNAEVTEWVKSTMGKTQVDKEKLLADHVLNSLINPVTQMLTLQNN